MAARFFTISDARFFVGTVALLNSLRLTGHDQEVVVLDRGLTDAQTSRLARERVTFERIDDRSTHPWLLKPLAASLDPHGTVVLIDSDMVVTSSLTAILERATAGAICVFPDHPSDLSRWFADWGDVFDLRAPLRRATYVNAGFVAFSAERWPSFLSRWQEACSRIPVRDQRPDDSEPFGQLDQDALNALLMSEVPEELVLRLPAYEWDMRKVAIRDLDALTCVATSGVQPLLHTPAAPKLWQEGGWRRVGTGAYGRLLARVLFADDVALRLTPAEVPFWVRPGIASRLAVALLSAYNRLPWVRRKAQRIPHRALRVLRAAVGRVASR